MPDKVIIIAEAGVNHNGSMELARKLVDVAAEAGADYVKFQTFKAEKLVSRDARKASYQQKNAPTDDVSQYAMLKKLELSDDDHVALVEYAKQKAIKFLSTGFDEESIDFLCELGVDVLKIPSGEITNLPYLQKIASKRLPVILSTGMSTMDEIAEAMDVLKDNGVAGDDITILHCNTEYPTPFEDVNLKAMEDIRRSFGVNVGYSDHTAGVEVPIAAVALGAVVIEQHFTLDRKMEGPDHKASLEPTELAQMVRSIRNIEKSLQGTGLKAPSPSELKNIAVARKSIHLKTDVKKGTILTQEHLTMKRPGDGISPMKIRSVLGKVINQDLPAETKLTLQHLTPLK
jgi:N-acetylneuraminate synthase/N,N'-diacetyllegionaminate synthase